MMGFIMGFFGVLMAIGHLLLIVGGLFLMKYLILALKVYIEKEQRVDHNS